ncbi:hypothetical protein NP493_553g02024 [Ridgeia piscesae]|uniref:Chitin-binding type-2 domain-containing protein n=1 Tax=Ridgeia piscesae TaxID=27915 RepID=A0AAD9KVQ9_RIDPI|nr:hypothetical protein NP493_553g02024 [Ridgeia piscesae]
MFCYPARVKFSCVSRRNGFYANPADCGKFYRCVYRRRYSFSCPAALYWDPAATACNWPAAVGKRFLRRCRVV